MASVPNTDYTISCSCFNFSSLPPASLGSKESEPLLKSLPVPSSEAIRASTSSSSDKPVTLIKPSDYHQEIIELMKGRLATGTAKLPSILQSKQSHKAIAMVVHFLGCSTIVGGVIGDKYYSDTDLYAILTVAGILATTLGHVILMLVTRQLDGWLKEKGLLDGNFTMKDFGNFLEHEIQQHYDLPRFLKELGTEDFTGSWKMLWSCFQEWQNIQHQLISEHVTPAHSTSTSSESHEVPDLSAIEIGDAMHHYSLPMEEKVRQPLRQLLANYIIS